MSQKSLVELALECVNAVVSTYSSQKVVTEIRTRARSIPEEAFARGLAYALTFVASKSGKNVVEEGLKATKCEDVIKAIKNSEYASKLSPEKLSYGIYGAIVLYITKNMGIVKGDKFESVIHEIMREPSVVELKMWNVLDWLKRITEAYIHE